MPLNRRKWSLFEMHKKIALMWSIGVIITSSLNYAAANLLIIIWGVSLPYYSLIVFILSVMIGIIVSNTSKSIIYAYTSMIGGLLIASTIFFAPYIMFAESVERFNIAAIVFFSFLAKVFLVSVILYFLGAILGCFLSERVLGRPKN